MDINSIQENKVFLPLTDWIQILLYGLVIPLVFALTILFVGLIVQNDYLYYLMLIIGAFLFSLSCSLFYLKSYQELKKYARKVDYFHFLPSWRELALYLIKQIYVVLFLGFIFSILLIVFNIEELPLWQYWGVSIIFSISFQSFLIVFSMKQKRDLLNTAKDEIKPEIYHNIKENHPNSFLINLYRYAEIKPASLFLSAGVMSFGWKKNICLISRYFQWKLTDNELIAVLSHEEGHVANNNIIKSYIHIGIDTFLRVMKFFIVFAVLNLLNTLIEEEITVFSSDLANSVLIASLLLLIFISSGTFNLFRYYRVFLIEIRADSYGATLVGYELLANTLRKLPSLIPSPIGYNQSSFLGFRIALLRQNIET